jgi:peptidyl-prolyl cis-trans isomerase C
MLAVASMLIPFRAGAQGHEYVARVNGEAVTRVEFERMLANPLTLEELRLELGAREPRPKELEQLAMRKLIHLRLLIQEARRRQIDVSDQDLDEAVRSIRRGFEDLGSFGAWVQGQGLDDRSLFDAVRGDMLADRARAALVERVRVSADEVQQYYDAHREDLNQEEVRLQIIAVDDEAAAVEIGSALRSGQDFGRIAQQRSQGARASRRGDAGWVPYASLQSPLREAVADLKPGEGRGPLKRGAEYLIVRLAARRPGPTPSLDQARPEIERRLLPSTRQRALQAWLTKNASRSKIELFTETPAGLASQLD